MSGSGLIAFHFAAATSKHPCDRMNAGERPWMALPSYPPPPSSSTEAPVFKKPCLSSLGCLGLLVYLFLYNRLLLCAIRAQQCAWKEGEGTEGLKYSCCPQGHCGLVDWTDAVTSASEGVRFPASRIFQPECEPQLWHF